MQILLTYGIVPFKCHLQQIKFNFQLRHISRFVSFGHLNTDIKKKMPGVSGVIKFNKSNLMCFCQWKYAIVFLL